MYKFEIYHTMGGGRKWFMTDVSKVHCKASGQRGSGMAYICAIQMCTVFHVTVILVNDVRFFHIGNGGALVIFYYEASYGVAFIVRYEL